MACLDREALEYRPLYATCSTLIGDERKLAAIAYRDPAARKWQGPALALQQGRPGGKLATLEVDSQGLAVQAACHGGRELRQPSQQAGDRPGLPEHRAGFRVEEGDSRAVATLQRQYPAVG
ncbi:hypothetical protein D3C72_1989230 [compost metagenome]